VSVRGALVAVPSRAVLGAVLGAALGVALLGACAQEHSAPSPIPPSSVPTDIPAYDASRAPAQAVLALVPLEATTLRLLDLTEIRRQVGLPELTSRSSAEDRAAFRARAEVDAPLLDRGVLEPDDARLRATYDFGADDVAWEAHFSGNGRRGWVFALGSQVDMGEVRRAAGDGVGALRGATVDVADRLVSHAAAGPGDPVWGGDVAWARLVPDPGEAFVVHRGCVESDRLPAPPPAAARLQPLLEPLSGFAVTFGDHVATVREGAGRADLFARVRLARDWSTGDGAFGQVFRSGVADPSGGRIGYDVPRPPLAAGLVRRDLLPFGVCAPTD
jgi:hypothetical protein